MKYDMRLNRYLVNVSQGIIKGATDIRFAAPLSDTPALSFKVDPNLVGGYAEVVSWIDKYDVAVEVAKDGVWREVRGGRLMILEDSFDPTEPGGLVSLTCVGVDVDLSGVVNLDASTLNKDGKRKYTDASPGTFMRSMVEQAQSFQLATAITLNFTDAADSAGTPWPRLLSMEVAPTVTARQMLQSLTDQGLVDWYFTGNQLNMFVPTSSYVSGVAPGVELVAGLDVDAAPQRRDVRDRVDRVAVFGETGYLATRARATTRPRGGRGAINAQGGVTQAATAGVLADALLERGAVVRGELTRTFNMSDRARFAPFVDYQVGQTIRSTGVTGSGVEDLRIRQVTLQLDGDNGGMVTGSLLLGDRLLEGEVRRARRISGIVGGSTLSGGSQSVPASPERSRFPVAVAGTMSFSPSSYHVGDLVRMMVEASWNPVTVDTDGDALTVTKYTIQGKPTSEAGWRDWGPTPGPSKIITGLVPGSQWHIRVRAEFGSNVSLWSDTFTLNVPQDDVPLPVPSQPVLSSGFTMVTVKFGGKDSSGATIAAPFDWAGVEVRRNGVTVGRIPKGASEAVFGPYTAGNVETFTLRSYSTTPTKFSAEGASNAVTVRGVLDDADFDTEIQKVTEQADAMRDDLEARTGPAGTLTLSARDANNQAVAAWDKALASANSGNNLVLNGGFEQTDTAGKPVEWPFNSSTGYPTGTARSGTRCLRLAPAGGNTWPVNAWFPSSTGRALYLEMWVKRESGTHNLAGPVGFVVQQSNTAGTIATTVVNPDATLIGTDVPIDGWLKVTATYTVAFTDTTMVRIAPWVRQSTNVYLIDDILAVDVTEAVAAQKKADDLASAVNNAVKTTLVEYAVNSSETVAPTTGWSSATPTRTAGTFVWTRTTITRVDGSTSTTSPALLTGNTGAQGATGAKGADGSSLFTWIKYADTPTTGMSDSPTGKTYFGIAYNKPTATESTAYADYDWSLIKGADGSPGVQGPAGADGQPTYTWVKYATSATGAGLSDDPTGKTYIGLAHNKSTATESTVATDYTWALFQGPQGVQGSQGPQGSTGATGATGTSVTAVVPYFQLVVTGAAAPAKPTTNPPGGSWVSSEPAYVADRELYRTELVTYSNSTFAYTNVSKVSSYTVAVNALISANGKNNIVVRTTIAGGTTNPDTGQPNVLGDLWRRVDANGNVMQEWTWSAGGWTARQVTSEMVTNMDVHKLTVSGTANIDAAVLKKLVVETAAAKLLTADRVVVASSDNLITNGTLNMGDATGWDSRLTYTPFTTSDPAPAGSGLKAYMKTTPGLLTVNPTVNVNAQGESIPIPVQQGVEYLLEVWLKASNPDTRFYMDVYDAATVNAQAGTWSSALDVGANGGAGARPMSATLLPTTWTKYAAKVVFNAGVDNIRMAGFYFNHNTSTGVTATNVVSVAGVRLRPRASGTLLVENAITTRELAVGSVQADQIKVGALDSKTIQSPIITGGSVTGTTVTGGTLQTTATASRGIKLTSSALQGWDANGNQTLNIAAGGSASTNLMVGQLRTNLAGSPSVVLVNETTTGLPGAWFSWDGSVSGAQAAIYLTGGDGNLHIRPRDTGSSTTFTHGLGLSVDRGVRSRGFDAVTGDLGDTSPAGTNVKASLYMGPYGSQGPISGFVEADHFRVYHTQQFYIAGDRASTAPSLRADTSSRLRIDGGTLMVTNMGTVTFAANMFADSNNQLYKNGSASRFKVNIQSLDYDGIDPYNILNVEPRTWTDRLFLEQYRDAINAGEANPEKARRVPGVVAEEVRDAGLDHYVTYDGDGTIDGVAYDRLWTLLIPVVRDLKSRLDALEATV